MTTQIRHILLRLVIFLFFLGTPSLATFAATYMASEETPPAPLREFRGAWVATVNNIDWPSRPGLSTSQQQQELISLLNQAATLHLNAILFQVRPACDALYESRFEPWSEYLTGTMGQAPNPPYDPLAFVIREAHQRGLELHAWFNPFRARYHLTQGPVSSRHISKTKPQWVRSYGNYLWLDPGDSGVQDYSLRVILDVVKRYDVDGVHLDDYFYPYKEKDAKGHLIDFPDSTSWKRYMAQGGRLARDDWRRLQVDNFVRKLYTSVKAQKAHVKVGISPFGIWRPGNPVGIEGLDAYKDLYADSRKWWNEGWMDYIAPQLYWPMDSKEQNFAALLKWWAAQNLRHRHLFPGINTANIGTRYAPPEIINEVAWVQRSGLGGGVTHWSIKALLQNRQGIGDQLLASLYRDIALTPVFPWLDSRPPAPPVVAPILSQPAMTSPGFTWQTKTDESLQSWLVQYREQGRWQSRLFSSQVGSCVFQSGELPEVFSVRAVDRCGNASIPTVLARQDATRPTATTLKPQPTSAVKPSSTVNPPPPQLTRPASTPNTPSSNRNRAHPVPPPK